MGYFKDTLKGVSWMGALKGVSRGVGFIRIAVLARLLTPSQFGVFAIASLVLAFLEMLTETGINVYLIQEESEIKDYVNTAWIVSIARGLLIGLLLLLLAPLIVSFFNSPDAYGILIFISMAPALRGFINPAVIRFQKELQFHKEFWFRLVLTSVDAIVSIVAVLVTHSVYGLIWGLTASIILEIILSFLIVKPRPKFVFDSQKAKKVIGRGKWITGAGIFNYLFQNFDNVVVGKLLGEYSLGLYQTAYRISTLPITEVADTFGRVTFPVYVRISGDKERLKKAFLKTLTMVSIMVIPFGALLYIFTNELVLIVLGENWLTAVPVLKILAIFGVLRAISGYSSTLFLAMKRQEYVTAVTGASILGLGISIVPLVSKFGIVGAGMSAIIGSLVALPLMVYFSLKIFR